MANGPRYLRWLAALALLLGFTWACGKTQRGDSGFVDGSGSTGGRSAGVGGSGAEGGSSAGGTAAGEGGTAPEDLASELLGRGFVLQSAEGFTPVEGTTVHIGFNDRTDSDETWLVFSSAGCSSTYHAAYFHCGDKICFIGSLDPTTDVGCSPEHHAQNEWLAGFFTAQPALALDGDVLTITGPDAVLVFRCDDNNEDWPGWLPCPV